jgi:hypothetical protein
MLLWRISIGWKQIWAAAGVGCIIWGYYQLFAVDMEKAMIGKTVTAVTMQGEVSGKAISFKHGKVVIASDKAVEAVSEMSIVEIDKISFYDYETRRAVMAVCISVAGGIVVWIALFFL